MPYIPIDTSSTAALATSATATYVGQGCLTLDTAGATDINNLRFYTTDMTSYPPTEPDPPKAIIDIRSIGIPGNAPMFAPTTFTWDVADTITSCETTFDPWVTTDRYFTTLTDTTSATIPLTYTYGIAGGNNTLALDTTAGGTTRLRKTLL